MKSTPVLFPSPPGTPNPFEARVERIRANPPGDQPALKAERIQELLRRFPGWQRAPDGPGLVRGYRFGTPADAASFTVFVAGVLESVEVTAKFEVVGPLVAVQVATGEKPGAVTQLDFDIVALIEGREE